MDNNGWAGRPGVPLNPEQDSEGHVWTVDGVMEIYRWVASKQWYENTRGHWFSPTCIEGDDYYHGRIVTGRIVTPAEVEARIAAAHKEWLAELNHDTDALMEAARDSALAECIAACEAVVRLYRVELPEQQKDRPGGIPYSWKEMWENSAEIAEDIIADIRALSDTPPGLVLVPREPTDAMIQAVARPLQGHAMLPLVAARIAWDAMVKAAGKGEDND
jgi:hypothetical protein